MLEAVFNSRVKTKIIQLLSLTNGALQVSDVARTLKVSKSRASECLAELAQKGILERRSVGRSVLYRMASNSLAKSISKAVLKERALIHEIEKEVLVETKRFRPVSLVLYGSAAKELKIGSDVDFLLLCRTIPSRKEIYTIVAKLTEKLGFHVSILPMSVKKFRGKAGSGEEFALNVMATGKLLYGKDLEDVVWQEP